MPPDLFVLAIEMLPQRKLTIGCMRGQWRFLPPWIWLQQNRTEQATATFSLKAGPALLEACTLVLWTWGRVAELWTGPIFQNRSP